MNALILFLVSCLVVAGRAEESEEPGFLEWSTAVQATDLTAAANGILNAAGDGYHVQDGAMYRTYNLSDSKWVTVGAGVAVETGGNHIGYASDGMSFAVQKDNTVTVHSTKGGNTEFAVKGSIEVKDLKEAVLSSDGSAVLVHYIMNSTSAVQRFTFNDTVVNKVPVNKYEKSGAAAAFAKDLSEYKLNTNAAGTLVVFTKDKTLPMGFFEKAPKKDAAPVWNKIDFKNIPKDVEKFTALEDGSLLLQMGQVVDVYGFQYFNCKKAGTFEYCSKTASYELIDVEGQKEQDIKYKPNPLKVTGMTKLDASQRGEFLSVSYANGNTQHYHLKFRTFYPSGAAIKTESVGLSDDGLLMATTSDKKVIKFYKVTTATTGDGLFWFAVIGCVLLTAALIIGAAKLLKPAGTGDEDEEELAAKSEDHV